MSYKLVATSQVMLYINGSVYAKVSSFSYSVATPKKEIRGLDSTDPTEYGITTQTVSGQMEIYRLASDGGLEGAGIVAPLSVLSREKYFTLSVIDRLTDTVMFTANNCTVENQSWSFATRALVTGSMTFRGITMQNEAGVTSTG